MNKDVLRKVYLEKRLFLSRIEWKRRCDLITGLFFKEVDLQPVNCLHLYLSMKDRNEPDTWLLIDQLKRDYPNIRLAVSSTHWADKSMKHFEYESTEQLELTNYGIFEPKDGRQIADSEIDLVLIPLISFDKTGHRIGYGAGFYDRFLAKVRPETTKIGFTIAHPIDAIIGVGEYDVRMDRCICPLGVYDFSSLPIP